MRDNKEGKEAIWGCCAFLQCCGEAHSPLQHQSPTGQQLPELNENISGAIRTQTSGCKQVLRHPHRSWGTVGAFLGPFLGPKHPHTTAWSTEASRKFKHTLKAPECSYWLKIIATCIIQTYSDAFSPTGNQGSSAEICVVPSTCL